MLPQWISLQDIPDSTIARTRAAVPWPALVWMSPRHGMTSELAVRPYRRESGDGGGRAGLKLQHLMIAEGRCRLMGHSVALPAASGSGCRPSSRRVRDMPPSAADVSASQGIVPCSGLPAA